jgi:voltage-gated potassium channel
MVPRRERKPKPPVTPQRVAELDRKRRHAATVRSFTRIAIAWTLLTGLYFVIPFNGLQHGDAFVRLAISLAVFIGAAVWELVQTERAELPEFRAITALGVLTPLFIVLYSGVYLVVSNAKPASFSVRLDHYKALYFMITTLSTVGYGDITPATNTARMLVCAQMLLDLILIGSIVRVLAGAAKRGLDRGEVATPDSGIEPASPPPE